MKKWILLFLFSLNHFAYGSSLTLLGEIYRPFSYVENDIKKGLVHEIVLALIEESEVKVEKSIIANWKDVFEHAKKTPNTLLYTIVRSKERESMFHWIGPILPREINLYGLKSRGDIQIKKFNDIKLYTVVSLNKGIGTDYLEKKGVKPEKTKDFMQAYHMLLKKRVDLAAVPSYSMNYIDKDKKLMNIKWNLKQKGSYYIALNKKTDPKIVRQLQDAYSVLIQNGTITKIKDKY